MTTLATLQTRLEEAQSALHLLMMGEKEARVQHAANKSVAYTETNRADLERYIQQLEGEIARIEGRPRRGRILVTF